MKRIIYHRHLALTNVNGEAEEREIDTGIQRFICYGSHVHDTSYL
jgi:Trm5-related predicted tRNA methylase